MGSKVSNRQAPEEQRDARQRSEVCLGPDACVCWLAASVHADCRCLVGQGCAMRGSLTTSADASQFGSDAS